jgi:hypothetical protein
MKNATREFIELLVSGTTEPIYICSLTNDKAQGGQRCVHTRDVDHIMDFIKRKDVNGRGTYYCVSSVRQNNRRCVDNAFDTRLIFADIDFKDTNEKPANILKTLKNLPLPPSRIHRSGNGFHPLWVLHKPTTELNRVKKILKKLCEVVGGDRHVCHVAALLRMPGTHNSKEDAWTLVTNVTQNQRTSLRTRYSMSV